MADNEQPSAVPICAHLASIEVVGNFKKKNPNTEPVHFVVVSVDDKKVAKSETKPGVPSQWEWQEDLQFLFHPSSTIKVEIYRESRLLGSHIQATNHLVGQYTGEVIELLEKNTPVDLKDKTGTGIAAQIKIKLFFVSEPNADFESLMKTMDAYVSRLDNTARATSVLSTLGAVLKLTKNIIDSVTDVHPILKVSSTVIFSVYMAVQQSALQDDTIRDLAESLCEMLGVAKERPDLLLIQGTDNVIEEIGRTSLKVVSLIYEYTRPPLAKRILNSWFFDMKTRIARCQKSCDDLKKKFDIRLIMDVHGTLKTIKDDEKAREIYQWLSAPDCSKNYNEAREPRQSGTCSWFLNGKRFLELQEKGGLLWIKGTAGCGKTILCASIIDKIFELHKNKTPIAYFFFDGRDSQKDLQLHDKFIRSLILQFSLQCADNRIPIPLVDLYGHGYHQPSTNSLQDTLYRIIDGLPSAYVIVDSLDECVERNKTLQWIKQIASNNTGKLHMVVTSRPEEDIRQVLQPLDQYCVDLVAEPDNHDIAIYLDQQFTVKSKWGEKLRETIKLKLAIGAQGMFRWVALQVMELEDCSSEHAVEKQLDALPDTLEGTYDRILLKIRKQDDRTDTKTFLQWLSFSTRPLTLAEIAETIAVAFDMENGPQYAPMRRYRDKRDVLKKCSGLITESEGRVKLAHFSIKEYLISERIRMGATSHFHLAEELSHAVISQTCLVYLLQFKGSDLVEEDVKTSYPLAYYAAGQWTFHARSGGIDKPGPSLTLSLAKNLFTHVGAAFTNWVQIWDWDEYNAADRFRHRMLLVDQHSANTAAPLYYAAQTGLQRISQYLLDEGADVNVRGILGGTALQAASSGGYERIVKLLLDKGADANVWGGFEGTALQVASSGGYEGIVRLLLDKGVDVNVQGGLTGTALQEASSRGHEGIVKLLLDNGADVNARGGFIDTATPLQAASSGGYEGIVKLLLDKEADINAQNGLKNTALQEALSGGYEGIVKLLLDKGADVNVEGGLLGTALQEASSKGYEEIVKLLLDKWADVIVRGGFTGTALQEASYRGYEGIVKLLLDKGVDVNMRDKFGGTALQAASDRGYEGIVKLLLESGADINMWGGLEGTALQVASYRGYDGVVKLLLDSGVDVDVQAGLRGTALQEASSRGHEGIVKLLLDKGADVNVQSGFIDTATPLQAAISGGYEGIVKLLLDKGAAMNT